MVPLKVLIVFLSLLTVVIAINAYIKRLKHDVPVHEKEEDAIIYIRSILFLAIPFELTLIAVFGVIAIIYSGLLIAGAQVPGLELTALYLSAIIFLLVIYNGVMKIRASHKTGSWILYTLIISAMIFMFILGGIDENIAPLLRDSRPYNLTIHILGVALALGGSVVVDLMFIHFLNDFKISARESTIMHLLSQMIVLGLIFLITSGIMLYYPYKEMYITSPRFLMKMTVVLFIIVNGGVLNLYLTPLLKRISLQKHKNSNNELLKRLAFSMGAMSFVSWFSAYLLAMLKILDEFSYLTIFVAYIILLGLGVIGSLSAKKYYELRATGE